FRAHWRRIWARSGQGLPRGWAALLVASAAGLIARVAEDNNPGVQNIDWIAAAGGLVAGGCFLSLDAALVSILARTPARLGKLFIICLAPPALSAAVAIMIATAIAGVRPQEAAAFVAGGFGLAITWLSLVFLALLGPRPAQAMLFASLDATVLVIIASVLGPATCLYLIWRIIAGVRAAQVWRWRSA
ncbi:MAG: hypothetical protein PSY12_12040, partial [bacterium]|nr:hypothetical protein [bacterium]